MYINILYYNPIRTIVSSLANQAHVFAAYRASLCHREKHHETPGVRVLLAAAESQCTAAVGALLLLSSQEAGDLPSPAKESGGTLVDWLVEVEVMDLDFRLMKGQERDHWLRRRRLINRTPAWRSRTAFGS